LRCHQLRGGPGVPDDPVCLANGYHPRILWLIGALYVVCTVLRLARFNVETEEDDKGGMFSGLPSPAAAGTIASFPIMAYGLRHLDYTGAEFTAWIDWITIWALPVVTLAVACLMVSRFPYNHTFHYLVRGRRNGPYVIRLVFALAIIFVLPQVSAPLLFCWYAFGTPVKVTWQRRIAPLFNDRDDAAPPPEPDLPVGPPAPVAARDPRLVRPVDLPPTRLPN
jgi:CDP-diacylglycerol--serine O-phosphatidyltransferase